MYCNVNFGETGQSIWFRHLSTKTIVCFLLFDKYNLADMHLMVQYTGLNTYVSLNRRLSEFSKFNVSFFFRTDQNLRYCNRLYP